MRFFSNDSLFGRIFGTLGDIITVNLLFVVCSLPLVTIGAAWTAACYTLIRKHRMADASIVQPFFASFRANLKQSTLAWLGMLVIGWILLTDIRIFAPNGPYPVLPVYILFLLLACIGAFTALFLFPVIACFENSLKKLIVEAFLFACGKPHVAVLMLFIAAVPVMLSLSSAVVFWAVLILWVFLGFGAIAWLHSLLLASVFRPYLSPIEDMESQDA